MEETPTTEETPVEGATPEAGTEMPAAEGDMAEKPAEEETPAA